MPEYNQRNQQSPPQWEMVGAIEHCVESQNVQTPLDNKKFILCIHYEKIRVVSNEAIISSSTVTIYKLKLHFLLNLL